MLAEKFMKNITKLLKYIPLIILLNIFPLIRGCGDNGYSESIGFPISYASIEKSREGSFDFPSNKIVPENLEKNLLINVVLLALVFLGISIYCPVADKTLTSIPFFLSVLLILFVYRALSPFVFFLSLPIAMAFQIFPKDSISDITIFDISARIVFMLILLPAFGIATLFTHMREKHVAKPVTSAADGSSPSAEDGSSPSSSQENVAKPMSTAADGSSPSASDGSSPSSSQK